MFKKRTVKIKRKLRHLNIDSLLVSNCYNILYLAGFKTLSIKEHEAFVVVANNNIYLLTDRRYINSEFTRSTLNVKLIEPGKGFLYHLKKIIQDEKIKRLGFEDNDLFVGEYQKIKKEIPAVTLVPVGYLIQIERAIKEQKEIENITKACNLIDKCLTKIIPLIRIGITEKEIAYRIEYWLKKSGGDIAFAPIVAVDANCAIPHYDTKRGSGIIKNNSIVLIDCGAQYDDYSSDITRMVFFGKNNQATNIYEKLLMVQEKTINAVNRLKEAKNIDDFCRQQLKVSNLPDFGHSVGHGVGLQVHEYPKISANSLDIIEPNQVFTIEPGVYFPGKFGLRIEDTVTVDNVGRVKVLTQFDKDFLFI